MRKPQYSGKWHSLRKAILVRDKHLCQINAPGCTGRATQVDHIIPVARGGPWHQPSNLRASCSTCNLARNRTAAIRPSRVW